MIAWIVAVYLLIGSIWLAECLRISHQECIVLPVVGFIARAISFAVITVFWPVAVIYAALVLHCEKKKGDQMKMSIGDRLCEVKFDGRLCSNGCDSLLGRHCDCFGLDLETTTINAHGFDVDGVVPCFECNQLRRPIE